MPKKPMTKRIDDKERVAYCLGLFRWLNVGNEDGSKSINPKNLTTVRGIDAAIRAERKPRRRG